MSEEFKERIVIPNFNENDTNAHEDDIEYKNAIHKVFSEYSPISLANIREKIRELYNDNKAKSEKEKAGLLNLMKALEREMFEKINDEFQFKNDREE